MMIPPSGGATFGGKAIKGNPIMAGGKAFGKGFGKGGSKNMTFTPGKGKGAKGKGAEFSPFGSRF